MPDSAVAEQVVHDKQMLSYNMRHIKSKNTSLNIGGRSPALVASPVVPAPGGTIRGRTLVRSVTQLNKQRRHCEAPLKVCVGSGAWQPACRQQVSLLHNGIKTGNQLSGYPVNLLTSYPATLYLCPMADVHDKQTRSYNMSRIRSTNTKPEMLLRKFLHANGFRYKLHDKTLPGKPDLVLPKYKTVIFIHGCFWHGHENCKYFVIPKTRTDWWLNKINSNKANDAKTYKALKKEGWKIITVWECQLKPAKLERTLTSLLTKLS